MIKKTFFVVLLLCVFVFAGCSSNKNKEIKKEKEEPKGVSSDLKECYKETELFELEEIGEPSGIVFDKNSNNLFVVSDEGSIYEVSREGVLIKGKRLSDGDFEGITSNPQNNFLYVAVENDEKILEINNEDFSVKREFFIDRYFNDNLVLEEGGNGIEGLHYDSQRNSFFIVNQNIDSDSENDRSALLEIEYPKQDQENNSSLKILNYYYSEVRDLSSITKGKEAGELIIVSDKNNKLLRFSKEKGFQQEDCYLVGEDQEGMTFDEEGNVFIAQDSGGILKLLKDYNQ